MDFDNMTLDDLYQRREDLKKDMLELANNIAEIGNEIIRVEQADVEDYFEGGMSDVEADADTLASCGWGTDEDYGCYNDMAW
jgi:hypothetical protein